jgi:hypothetical protein
MSLKHLAPYVILAATAALLGALSFHGLFASGF